MKAVFVLGPALLCAAAGEDRLSITLLLDTNPPWLDYLRAEKKAAIEFFKRPLGNSESAALTRFDQDFWIVADFAESGERLRTAAEKLAEHGAAADATLDRRTSFTGMGGFGVIQTGRNAELYQAAYLAARHMQERKGRKALIVVSDWSDLGTHLGLESVLEAAEESSTILYPVRLSKRATITLAGRSEAATNAMLKKLAEDTGGRDLDVDGDHPLEALLEQIRQELRAHYLPGYTPLDTPGANVYRRIEVGVDTAGLEVRAGYDCGTKPGQAAEPTARFSATGTADAPPPNPPRTMETIRAQTPARPACTLFTSGAHAGLLGRMESLLPFTEKDAAGPEDAEAARIVAEVAETYRKAQSIDMRGVWETEQKGRLAEREFNRQLRMDVLAGERGVFTVRDERAGAGCLRSGVGPVRLMALPSETTPADFTLPDQAGRAVRFAELKGSPMVLTFWHT